MSNQRPRWTSSAERFQSRCDQTGFDRAVDACLNRAREGLRVLEDYARFVLDDRQSVQTLKDLRHDLVSAEKNMSVRGSSENRDVSGDVGTDITTAREQQRDDAGDIVDANARRVQEALRSLEEFSKLSNRDFAAQIKQLRYRAYDIHQILLARADQAIEPKAACARKKLNSRHLRLQRSTLCVLISESNCRGSWKDAARTILDAGADMLQLREKDLSDRELIVRARWLSEACETADALCIINDRPDIARISGADGVHLGQDDCAVDQAREIVGDNLIVGLSTHSVDDLTSDAMQYADYLGAGPVFESRTKNFDSLAGLEYLRQLKTIPKPWFAIGGIRPDNLIDVVSAGATRVAVSSAVLSAESAGDAVRRFRRVLDTAEVPEKSV